MEIHRIESGTYGIKQFRNPSSVLNKRFAQPSDIDINHGWKIHADIVSGLSQDQAFARMGRSHSGAIIDTKAAESFDADLARLGISYDDFQRGFLDHKLGAGRVRANEYMDPVGAVKSMLVMHDQGIQYKLSGLYGSGRHLTAYPQSLEKRDALISELEKQVGHLLVDQNDPTFRLGLGETGTKNTPLSQKVSGRFTTDYIATKADGTPDFTNSDTGEGAGLPEFTITGSVSEKEAQTINKVIQAEPRFDELLHGSSGYKSPYRTIEDIFRDRSSPTGHINPSQRAFTIDEDIVYGASSYGPRKPEPIKTKIKKSTEEPKKPLGSSDVDDKKTKPVAEAVKTGDKKPVIKVGEVVESKGEKVKKNIPPRVKGKDVEKMASEDSASKPKTIKDEIIDAAISSGTKKTEEDEEGKDVDEKLADKIKEKAEEKLDPVSKVENFIEKKKDEAIEELKDSVFKADDEAFARELAEKEGKGAATKASIGSSDLDDSIKPTKATPAPVSPTPKGMDAAVDPGTKGTAASRRIVDAGGRTAADTPAARAVLAADSAADGSIFSMTPKAAAKTVGEDIMSMAKNLVKGHKNAKNLRLAATAALLSSTGYGLGKVRNRMGTKQNQEVSPDESEMLRRSLLEDG